MTSMPELGWAGTVGIICVIGALVVALVLYHVWFDRRLIRPDAAQRAPLDPAEHRPERQPKTS